MGCSLLNNLSSIIEQVFWFMQNFLSFNFYIQSSKFAGKDNQFVMGKRSVHPSNAFESRTKNRAFESILKLNPGVAFAQLFTSKERQCFHLDVWVLGSRVPMM